MVVFGLAAAEAHAQAGWSGERQAYRGVFTAVRGGDFGAAERQAQQAKDPLLSKLVHWLEATRGAGGLRFTEIVEFMDRNPDWPGQNAMRQRAEELTGGVPEATLRAWFARFPPITAYGKLRQ